MCSQGLHGFDGRGASRGKEAGDKSNKAKQESHGCKGDHVGRPNAIEHAAQEARKEQRGANADAQAGDGEPKPLLEHLAKNGALAGSKGDADADFMSALAGGVRDDTIDADGGENQGQQSE